LIVAGGGGGGGGFGSGPGAGGSGGGADISGSTGDGDGRGDVGGSGGGHGDTSEGGAAGSPSSDCGSPGESSCAADGAEGLGGFGGTSAKGGGGGGGGGVFGGGGGGGGDGSYSETSPGQYEIYNGGGGGGGGGASGVPADAGGVSNVLLLESGEDSQPSVTFSWTGPSPTVLTEAASHITGTTAVLNGSVNPNAAQPTACEFHISPAPDGLSTFPCSQQLSTGSTTVAVSATAIGLTPGTTYSVSLIVSTVQGSTSGATVTFTTTPVGGPPAATPGKTLSVSNFKISPSKFQRSKHATISFSLLEAASIHIAFETIGHGVLVGHKCVAISRHHRKGKRCVRYTPVRGGLSVSATTGKDKFSFSGALEHGAHLAPGTYRLSLTARVSGSAVTATEHPGFTLFASRPRRAG